PAVWGGYCAHVGAGDLRVIGTGSAVEQGATIVRNKLESYIVSTDGKALEEIVVELLSKRNETLAVAESCTGGYLASTITNVSGSSAVFLEGDVTYSNDAKIRTLNIPQLLIQRLGAVSEEVAGAMAEGARTRSGATYALSPPGVVGPPGAREERP